MNKFSTFICVVFGIALLLALTAGGYILTQNAVNLFSKLEPQIATIAAIASVVALLFSSIIANGLKSRPQKEQETKMIADKRSLYDQLLLFWIKQLNQPIAGNDPAVVDDIKRIEQRLVLCAPQKLITTYMDFQRLMTQEGSERKDVSTGLVKLVMEMRKDLGQGVFNLREQDVLELLLPKL